MTPATATEPLLLTAKQAALVLGCSRSKFYEMKARDLIPAPIEFDGQHRWRRAELERWTDAGCPRRATWEAMSR